MLCVKNIKKINESKEINSEVKVLDNMHNDRITVGAIGKIISISDISGKKIYTVFFGNDLIGKFYSEQIEEIKQVKESIQKKEYNVNDEVEYILSENDNIPEGMKVGDRVKGKIKKIDKTKNTASIEWETKNKDKDDNFDLGKV